MKRAILCFFVVSLLFAVAVAEETIIVHHYLGTVTEEATWFNEAQSDIYVVSVMDEHILTPSIVLSLLQNEQDIVDVFTLHSAQVGFDALIKSQLSPMDDIEMPLLIRQSLESGGILQAWPINATIERAMSYGISIPLLNEAGIQGDAISTDLSVFLNQLSVWYADGTLTNVRLLEKDNQRELLREITLSYAKYVCCNGGMETMDWETLTQMLKDAEILLTRMQEADCMSSMLPSILKLCSAEDYLTDSINTGIISERDGREIVRFTEPMMYLQCVPANNLQPVIPITVTVGIIEPSSSKIKHAQSYLHAAKTYQPVTSMLILGSGEETPLNFGADILMQERYASIEPYLVVLDESFERWANKTIVQRALDDLVAGNMTVDQFIQIVK